MSSPSETPAAGSDNLGQNETPGQNDGSRNVIGPQVGGNRVLGQAQSNQAVVPPPPAEDGIYLPGMPYQVAYADGPIDLPEQESDHHFEELFGVGMDIDPLSNLDWVADDGQLNPGNDSDSGLDMDMDEDGAQDQPDNGHGQQDNGHGQQLENAEEPEPLIGDGGHFGAEDPIGDVDAFLIEPPEPAPEGGREGCWVKSANVSFVCIKPNPSYPNRS